MIYDCSYCDVDVDNNDKEEYDWHKSRGHELLPKLGTETIAEIANEKDEKQPNTSEKIYQFAKSKIKKCIVSDNDSSQVFALIEINGNLQTFDLSNSFTRSWLRFSYHQHTGDNPSDDMYANVINLIKAEAIHGNAERKPIYNRVAMSGNSLFYDLCTDDWKLVKITKESVKIVPMGLTTPVFLRTQNQKPQFKPEFDAKDALSELVKLLRIRNEDAQIFKIHIVSMFLEGFPIPIMSIVGEHGSIKSTISKSIKQIVDTSGAPTISMSSDENMILSFHHRYCICFDNVSRINQSISDILCKAITGDGNAKRKLYTDSDEIIFQYRRKIILNGIAPNLEYPDLMDRNITYSTNTVPLDERITEKEYDEKFNTLRPSVLGQIFQILSDSMKIYEDVKKDIKQLPRMADFAIWGECISQCLGFEPMSFIKDYQRRLRSHSVDLIESYPMVAAIEEILRDIDCYEGSIEEFYNVIKKTIEDKGIDTKSRHIKFPKASNQVKAHITRLKPNLRELGYETDLALYNKRDGKYKRGRQVITISKIKNTLSDYCETSGLPSLPSLSPKIQERIKQLIDKPTDEDRKNSPAPALPYLAKFVPVLVTDEDDKHDKGISGIGMGK